MSEEREERREEREGEEEEEEFERLPPAPPMPWGSGLDIEPTEGSSDTLLFHIGSPFFLRMRVSGDRACEPFNGRPFYFDAGGSQLGWGFEEVADTLLFPHAPGSCQRIVMLSSENSNRVAEGYYTFKTLIFLDATDRLYSDTLVIHAVRSRSGADTISYGRFLQEQAVKNSPTLHDPETLRALFAEQTPKSAESEIYRAVILYRAGDNAGADAALQSSRALESRRGRPVGGTAAEARTRLTGQIHPQRR